MILFLDFDGVLHPERRDAELFCRVALLWDILRTCPDVDVVFSTTWRDIHRPEELLDFVTYGGGEDIAHRFIGSTPSLEAEDPYDRRDLEIQRWIDANGYTGHWLAIDDMPELFNGGHPNLYVVDGTRGLTNEDVLAILGRIQ